MSYQIEQKVTLLKQQRAGSRTMHFGTFLHVAGEWPDMEHFLSPHTITNFRTDVLPVNKKGDDEVRVYGLSVICMEKMRYQAIAG